MLQQACRFGRDLPLAGVGQAAPGVYRLSHLVDDGCDVVLLRSGRERFALVKHHFFLLDCLLALLGLWNGRNELGAPAGRQDLLGGLAVAV